MRLHIHTEESERGFWVFKEPAFDIVFRLEMTAEEFNAYNKLNREVYIAGGEYTSDRTIGETRIRSDPGRFYEIYEYDYKYLNPTVHEVVKAARKNQALRYTCKSRDQLERFKSALERGVAHFSTELKKVLGSATSTKTIDY